jgi:hypothetical protein
LVALKHHALDEVAFGAFALVGALGAFVAGFDDLDADAACGDVLGGEDGAGVPAFGAVVGGDELGGGVEVVEVEQLAAVAGEQGLKFGLGDEAGALDDEGLDFDAFRGGALWAGLVCGRSGAGLGLLGLQALVDFALQGACAGGDLGLGGGA